MKPRNQTNTCQPRIPHTILHTSALPCMTTRYCKGWQDGIKGRTREASLTTRAIQDDGGWRSERRMREHRPKRFWARTRKKSKAQRQRHKKTSKTKQLKKTFGLGSFPYFLCPWSLLLVVGICLHTLLSQFAKCSHRPTRGVPRRRGGFRLLIRFLMLF